MPLRPRTFDLNKLVRNQGYVHKPTTDSKGVALSAAICESVFNYKVADEGGVSVTVQGIENQAAIKS